MTEIIPVDPFHIPDDVESMPDAPRAVVAFELRKAGADYDFIAEKLGYASADSAKRAIHQRIAKYYQSSKAEIEEVVGLELSRLDQLQLIAWREAKDGNLKAVDQILKIMERRAKLLGLDQANEGETNVTQQVAVIIGGDESQYLSAVAEAREQLKRGS